MTSARRRICRDANAVAAAAETYVVRAAEQARRDRGRFHLALAGGSTPRRLYERLARHRSLDVAGLELFWGDERAVPPDSPHSNYAMARASLLEPLGVPEAQVHRMPADADDLDAAARDYESLLCEFVATPPRLDLVLLGLGEDGHTASLFPGQPAVHERRRWVVATPAPVLAPRLTLTLPALRAAHRVLFLVTGAAKHAALHRVWHGDESIDAVPARGVEGGHARVTWIVDRAAAGSSVA